jgi:hypothetical protein
MTEPDVDRPDESTEVDITLVGRGITVTARVERSSTDLLVVVPAGEGTDWKLSIRRGAQLEIYWVGGHEERTVKGYVAEVEEAFEPRWHLTVSGPAERSQRRRAVRARVEASVFVPWLSGQLIGKTVDLSEAGMRALFDGWGLPPDPGTLLDVGLTLDEDVLDLRGEVVWHADRGGGQWLMAMRFQDVSERISGVLRRHVFQALRDERTRTLD